MYGKTMKKSVPGKAKAMKKMAPAKTMLSKGAGKPKSSKKAMK
jgi:hypothetical protein